MRRAQGAGESFRRRTSSFSPRPTRRSGSAGARAGCSSIGPSGSRACAQVLNEGGTTEMILRDVRFWGLETVQAGYALVELEAASRSAARGAREAVADARRRRPSSPHPARRRGIRHAGQPSALARSPTRCGTSTGPRGSRRSSRFCRTATAAFLEARIHWSGPYHHPEPPGLSSGATSRCLGAAGCGSRDLPAADPSKTSGARGCWWFRRPRATVDRGQPLPDAVHGAAPARRRGDVPGNSRSARFPRSADTRRRSCLRARGIPTYGFAPIPMNITDSARRHGNDERVFLRDYLNGVRPLLRRRRGVRVPASDRQLMSRGATRR